MADDQEHDFHALSDEAFQRAEDRRRGQSGEQHPMRYQFEGMYEGRPELSGTPSYGRNWLSADIPNVPRFRGRTNARERERAAYSGGRGFSINMTTHNYPGSITSTNYGGTTHNYGMSGVAPITGPSPDAPWEPGAAVSASAPSVSFAPSRQEPEDPGFWGTARGLAGEVAGMAGRGMVRGVVGIMNRRGAKAKGTQFDNTPAPPDFYGGKDPFGGGPGVQEPLF